MDIEEIRTLTDLMVNNDLCEIMIRDGEKRIVLRRQGAVVERILPAAMPAHAPADAPAPIPVSGAPATPAAVPEDDGLKPITSPMVGTFYAAPDPESPPYVKVGDRVDKDTVVCVIVAMKVNNEIKAGITGTIESIEVANETAVDCGHVLMKVRP